MLIIFRKAKSYFNGYLVSMAKYELLAHGTSAVSAVTQEWLNELGQFFTCPYTVRKGKR